MTIFDDNIALHCELEKPSPAPARCPLVLVFHGFTGHMEEPHIVAAASAMRESGCATLRVELYGHGRSGGQFRDHTLHKWLSNGLAVLDCARRLDFVSGLYLCGHSQGGLLAMLLAAMEPDRVKGILPLSPAWNIPEDARRGELLGKRFDPQHIPETLETWEGLELDGNYLRVAQTIRAEDAIDRYAGPVLLIHGDADEAVPYRWAEEAARRYRDCALVRIPGDTHCYDRHLDQVTAAVRDWLRQQISLQ